MTEEAEKTPEVSPPASGKRLTSEQWREIETHWEYGTKRTVEICQEYGISASAVTQHFESLKRAGTPIIKGSKKHLLAAKTAAAVTTTAATTAAVEVSEFAGKRKKRIEQTKETLYQASLANHIFFNEIQRAIKLGTTTLAQQEKNLKALRHAEAWIKANRENRYVLLDIEREIDELNLPILSFEDLTQEEISTIQNSDDDDGDDLDGLDDIDPDDDIIAEGS